ncbi:hypothetical protein [Leptospira santarosai]|uniref:hypothetical protein n=1 Tax=Leptospira santarosai TaxID=28183 RepID=UPI0005193D97|nr:hypothetical protein [Leptospira santarosai]
MKLSLTKLFMIILPVYFNMNCYIGTQRETCRYNLKESFVAQHCRELFPILLLGSSTGGSGPDVIQRREQLINFELLNCLDYYEKLKECNKEENRYIPSIYGINSNPVFSPKGSSIVFRQ